MGDGTDSLGCVGGVGTGVMPLAAAPLVPAAASAACEENSEHSDDCSGSKQDCEDTDGAIRGGGGDDGRSGTGNGIAIDDGGASSSACPSSHAGSLHVGVMSASSSPSPSNDGDHAGIDTADDTIDTCTSADDGTDRPERSSGARPCTPLRVVGRRLEGVGRRSEANHDNDEGGGAMDSDSTSAGHPRHCQRNAANGMHQGHYDDGDDDGENATSTRSTGHTSLLGFVGVREREERERAQTLAAASAANGGCNSSFFGREHDDQHDDDDAAADSVDGASANVLGASADAATPCIDVDTDGTDDDELRRLSPPNSSRRAGADVDVDDSDSFFCRSSRTWDDDDDDDESDGSDNGEDQRHNEASDNDDGDSCHRQSSLLSSPPERDLFFCRSMTEDSGNRDADVDADVFVVDGAEGVKDTEADSGACSDAESPTSEQSQCSSSADVNGTNANANAPGPTCISFSSEAAEAEADRLSSPAASAETDDGPTQHQHAESVLVGEREEAIEPVPSTSSILPQQGYATPKGNGGKTIVRRRAFFEHSESEPALLRVNVETTPRTPKSSEPQTQQQQTSLPSLPSLPPPPDTPPPSFLFSSPEKLRPLVGRPLTRVASAASISLRTLTAQTATPVKKARVKAQKVWQANRRRASELIKRRRARRAAKLAARQAALEARPPPRSPFIIIPADHPLKTTWDVLTVILTVFSAYHTHQSIRDRTYDQSPFVVFIEFWFVVDILLNFVTEHKNSDGTVIRDGKAVWARYLTGWFAIDALSLVPWERIYVRPIVERQKRRNIFTKTFFRSKAVVRVTRVLRGRHLKLFGNVAKQTKQVGVGGQRLLRLIIRYVPKYLLFCRNMRSILVLRTLRQVHFLRKLWKQLMVTVRTEPMVVLRRPGKVFRAATMADWSDDENDDGESIDSGDDESDDDDDGLDDYLDDDEYVNDDEDDDEGYAYPNGDSPTAAAVAGAEDCRVVLLPKLDGPTPGGDERTDGRGGDGVGGGGGISGEPAPVSLRFRSTAAKKRRDDDDGGRRQDFFLPAPPF